ncbi:hypothetical protein VKT23_002782 [Stygiomarasmius scandens]|uniref:Uncharacterized protein n=1 Tax=Marasmiellus scandens TaxID=2682957 RepID=A0ABR1K1L7_9AGAR
MDSVPTSSQTFDNHAEVKVEEVGTVEAGANAEDTRMDIVSPSLLSSSGQVSNVASDYSPPTPSAPSSPSLILAFEASGSNTSLYPPSPSPFNSTSPNANTIAQPNYLHPHSSVATAVANFRPSPRDVISGIAPHVFDERRRRRRGSRRSSNSFSRYERDSGSGSRSRSRSRSQRRPSLESSSRSASVARYSVTCESSPLRVSAVIAVDDLDLFLDATATNTTDKNGHDTNQDGLGGRRKENQELPKAPSKPRKTSFMKRPRTASAADCQSSQATNKPSHFAMIRNGGKLDSDSRSVHSVSRRNSLNVKMDSLKMGLKGLMLDMQLLKSITGKLKTKP